MRQKAAALALVCLVLFQRAAAAEVVDCLDDAIDDTAQIQAAIDLVGNYGTVQLLHRCRVGSLDLTNTIGVTLHGEGGLATRIYPQLSGVAVIDVSGSSHVILRDLHISGWGSPPSGIVPAVAILSGQTSAYTADTLLIERVRVDGWYSVAALYVLGTASSGVEWSQFYNYQPGAATVIVTGRNMWNVVSAYVTLSGQHAPSDWTLIGVEIHNFGAGWALWLGGARSVRFIGGNTSSGHTLVSSNAVTIGSTTVYPDDIVFLGTTFYGDELTGALPACAVSGVVSGIDFLATYTPTVGGVPIPLTGCPNQ